MPRHKQSDAEFAKGLAALSAFVERTGTTRVKVGHVDPSGYHLYNWLRVQRGALSSGRLAKDRADRLRTLGVTGLFLDEVFERNIALFLKAKAFVGNTSIRTDFEIDGFPLGEWLAQVKHRARTGVLAAKWISRLGEAGIDVGYVRHPEARARPASRPARERKFERGIALLEDFKTLNGHVLVSQKKGVFRGFDLGSWLHLQRRKWKENRLSDPHVKSLSDLGVKRPRTTARNRRPSTVPDTSIESIPRKAGQAY
ncbi:hypothetical protein G6L37_02125 [Agrobacterium rubi]|nr:hypothetical protein [Agrobacterium rubi]NTF24191.1 hypothetical protein [Agrobacterium rubi]